MKRIPWGAALTVCLLLPAQALQAAEDGVALAIIYDTSGSMGEQVPDASGRNAPKYVIANRAL